MSTRKVSYTKLLKEALTTDMGSDTSKTVDITGPMTKHILSYKGDGELKTTSDAAAILERYYFGDDNDGRVSVLGEDDQPSRNAIDDIPDKNINKTRKDIEKAVTEQDEEEDVTDDKDEKDEEDLSEAEEAVIEKLIAEMEDTDDELDVDDDIDDKEKVEEIGPIGNPSDDEDDDIQEAFKIFREEIEDEDDEDDEDDDATKVNKMKSDDIKV